MESKTLNGVDHGDTGNLKIKSTLERPQLKEDLKTDESGKSCFCQKIYIKILIIPSGKFCDIFFSFQAVLQKRRVTGIIQANFL